jgi:anti-sigma B factor antagonist
MTEPPPRGAVPKPVLEIDQFRDDEGVVVELHGELDLSCAAELERQLTEITSERPRRLIIDLRSLDFMDSTGLALMVRTRQAADAAGYPLLLRPGNHQVRRLFELSGLNDAFAFFEPGQGS